MDIKRLRSETPGLEHVLHFASAGASLMPQPVIDAVSEYQQQETLFGGYRVEEDRSDQIAAVYHSIARLINASAEEIALSDSATRSWTSLFYSLPLQRGDIILTSIAEYASNVIAFLQLEKRLGIRFEVIPNDATGQLSVSALEEMMSPAVKLVAITHTPTNGGLVNPAEAIGAVTRKKQVLYLLDACQTIGQYPVDVERIGCDFLTATGRKYLRGPRGTGFMYVRRKHLEWLEPCMLDLYGATWDSTKSYTLEPTAKRFEFWEKNYTAVVGLGAAVDYCNELGIEHIWKRVQALANTLRQHLDDLPGITVADRGVVRCGIVTFAHDSCSPEHIVRTLQKQMVNISTTTKYGTRFDMEERGLDTLVRTSVHYYNNEDDITQLVQYISDCTGKNSSQT